MRQLSCSMEAGAATEALAAAVQASTGHLPPAHLAMAALRAPVRWRASPIGGGEALPHRDAVAATIRAEVQRRFAAESGRVPAVVPVGGGSVLLDDRLGDVLPGDQVAVTAEEAVFANAAGFRWARGPA